MRQAGSVNRADSLFKMEPARKNKPARFPLTSYNRKAISTKITTDCRVGFKMMQNSVSIYKRASSPHVITSIFLKKNVYCYLFISAQFAKHCTYAVSIDNVINTYTIVASLTKELAPVTKSCL